MKCQICFDNLEKNTSNFCGEECDSVACQSCLATYFTLKVTDGYDGACPPMICPFHMDKLVPFQKWSLYVPSDISAKYVQRAKNIISIRCIQCDQRVSMLYVSDDKPKEESTMKPESLMEFDRNVLAPMIKNFATLQSIQKNRVLFMTGLLSASCFLDLTNEALVEGLTGGKGGLPCPQMVAILHSLGGDPEREVALYLAYLRLFPFIETPCCKHGHCFRCQTSNFHEGYSCEEYQASNTTIDNVLPCPHCGLQLTKGDGCNQIDCLCGQSFSWDLEIRKQNKQLAVSFVESFQHRSGEVATRVWYECCDNNFYKIEDKIVDKMAESVTRGLYFKRSNSQRDLDLDNYQLTPIVDIVRTPKKLKQKSRTSSQSSVSKIFSSLPKVVPPPDSRPIISDLCEPISTPVPKTHQELLDLLARSTAWVQMGGLNDVALNKARISMFQQQMVRNVPRSMFARVAFEILRSGGYDEPSSGVVSSNVNRNVELAACWMKQEVRKSSNGWGKTNLMKDNSLVHTIIGENDLALKRMWEARHCHSKKEYKARAMNRALKNKTVPTKLGQSWKKDHFQLLKTEENKIRNEEMEGWVVINGTRAVSIAVDMLDREYMQNLQSHQKPSEMGNTYHRLMHQWAFNHQDDLKFENLRRFEQFALSLPKSHHQSLSEIALMCIRDDVKYGPIERRNASDWVEQYKRDEETHAPLEGIDGFDVKITAKGACFLILKYLNLKI